MFGAIYKKTYLHELTKVTRDMHGKSNDQLVPKQDVSQLPPLKTAVISIFTYFMLIYKTNERAKRAAAQVTIINREPQSSRYIYKNKNYERTTTEVPL